LKLLFQQRNTSKKCLLTIYWIHGNFVFKTILNTNTKGRLRISIYRGFSFSCFPNKYYTRKACSWGRGSAECCEKLFSIYIYIYIYIYHVITNFPIIHTHTHTRWQYARFLIPGVIHISSKQEPLSLCMFMEKESS
jgi:hypothetical protein